MFPATKAQSKTGKMTAALIFNVMSSEAKTSTTYYYNIKNVGVNRHGGTPPFAFLAKVFMLKCSQTCGAPQAVYSTAKSAFGGFYV